MPHLNEMAWLDRHDNGGLFNESFETDPHDASQLLVLVFRAYFSPFIFVHGVIGNVLSLVIFCRLHKRTPGRFNQYAIAITFYFLVILVFDTLLDDFVGRGLWWLTHYRIRLKLDQVSSLSCKVITYVTDSSGFIATMTLAVFGLDRVRTVCLPFQFRGDRHLSCSAALIIGVSVVGLVLFSPTLVFYDVVNSNTTNQTSCTLTNPALPGATYTLLIYVLGSYTIPTVIIVVCNLIICCQLVDIKRKQRKCGIDVSSRGDIRRIIGHLAINTAFLLLMIPLAVVVLMRYESTVRPSLYSIEYQQRLIHLSRFFSSLLSIYFSSSFWVFFLFLPSFRDAVIELALASPLIASSVCGPCLYRRMTYTGARRLRTKSMTPTMIPMGDVEGILQNRTSLPPSATIRVSLHNKPKPVRSRSTSTLAVFKT
ncbi:unnamed protein product [Mesocestoides corti]|uniref:G_PROTEIN_RECEP_F1_2 domain-containing protein n=1 Tax=Mesocestoides corti TaxID=53468 RepID=A0A0R3U1B0_MESCO|nr:unnamed protein product [Mesocestoides corti]